MTRRVSDGGSVARLPPRDEFFILLGQLRKFSPVSRDGSQGSEFKVHALERLL